MRERYAKQHHSIKNRNVDHRRAHHTGRQTRGRHRHHRLHRHAGATGWQASLRSVVPRGSRRARRRVLQLPARRRCREQHRRWLPDVVVGDGLWRHGDAPRPVDSSHHPVADGDGARDGRPDTARRNTRGAEPPRDPEDADCPPGRARPRALRRYRTRVHRLRQHLPRSLGEGIHRAHPVERLQHRLRDSGVDPHGASAA